MKFHMNLFHKRDYSFCSLGFKFKLSLGFEFLVKAQENVSKEVKGKVQIQVKAGIWLNKKKQSST